MEPCLPPFHAPPTQLSLDLGTPLEVVEMLRSTVEAHVRAHPNEFGGSSAGGVRSAARAVRCQCNTD